MAVIDFKGLLDEMEEDEIFTIANESRPPANYLWNSVLPDVKRRGYSASAANMKIIATMSKLTGMDSRYARGGAARRFDFEHKLAKLGIEMLFPEEYLRQLREIVNENIANGVDDKEELLETMYNFTRKLLVQPHEDTKEWLKGQAILTGLIDWQSDDIRLQVDYGVPSANFLPARTGTTAYGGSGSLFWQDWRAAQQILKNRVRGVFASTPTIQSIIYNPVNGVRLVAADDVAGVFKFQRVVNLNGQNTISDDIRDNMTIFAYDDSGEVLDDSKPGSGETKNVPFCPNGAIAVIGEYDSRAFTIGTGSTPDKTPVSVGYTHIGPTEEGNGRLGMWAKAYVPEGEEYSFIGKSATNVLPVIEAPERIVVLNTQVS